VTALVEAFVDVAGEADGEGVVEATGAEVCMAEPGGLGGVVMEPDGLEAGVEGTVVALGGDERVSGGDGSSSVFGTTP
jgi:hypothetical protein